MFILNETNVFRVYYTPVDIRLGLIQICQQALSNNFNPSDNAAHVVYNYCHDQPPTRTLRTPRLCCLSIRRWREGVWGIKNGRMLVLMNLDGMRGHSILKGQLLIANEEKTSIVHGM